MSSQERENLNSGMRVGWVGLTVDSILAAGKLVGAWYTGSRALFGDALYSLIDVLSALAVLGTFRVSRKKVDEEHPYGYGKIEFLAVVFVSLVIASFAVLLLYRVAHDLISGAPHTPSPIVTVVALISVVACLTIWQYAKRVGKRLNSPVILTNAEHHHADLISSSAVLVAALLSWVGLGFADPVVAILEVGHILYTSWRLLHGALAGLLDASVDKSRLEHIAKLVAVVPGIVDVGNVRIRSLGSSLWIDMQVRVGATRRMSEVAHLRELVRLEVLNNIDHVANIVIEVLPCTTSERSLTYAPES